MSVRLVLLRFTVAVANMVKSRPRVQIKYRSRQDEINVIPDLTLYPGAERYNVIFVKAPSDHSLSPAPSLPYSSGAAQAQASVRNKIGELPVYTG